MVDPQKPCVTCEAVDRNNSGQCRPCRKKMKQTYRQSEENLAKNRDYNRKYRQTENGRAKAKACNRKYCQSAEGRAKKAALHRKYRHAEGFRERLIAAKEKSKKRNFEFSLQTQQKAIEQCQPKST